jgi:hypothetical protein
MSANKDININLKDLPQLFDKLGHKVLRGATVLFILVVGLLYGFLLLRIMTLSNVQPDETSVSSEVAKLSPHIDQNAADQLQSLEDNSVNVQTLFNQARDNPFGE